jgi:hypothetical protein
MNLDTLQNKAESNDFITVSAESGDKIQLSTNPKVFQMFGLSDIQTGQVVSFTTFDGIKMTCKIGGIAQHRVWNNDVAKLNTPGFFKSEDFGVWITDLKTGSTEASGNSKYSVIQLKHGEKFEKLS